MRLQSPEVQEVRFREKRNQTLHFRVLQISLPFEHCEILRSKNASMKSLRKGNGSILRANLLPFSNLRDVLSWETRLRTLSRNTRCSNGTEICSNRPAGLQLCCSMRVRAYIIRKLKNTKFYSEGFLVNRTKICTNENFPLYGTWCTSIAIENHLSTLLD